MLDDVHIGTKCHHQTPYTCRLITQVVHRLIKVDIMAILYHQYWQNFYNQHWFINDSWNDREQNFWWEKLGLGSYHGLASVDACMSLSCLATSLEFIHRHFFPWVHDLWIHFPPVTLSSYQYFSPTRHTAPLQQGVNICRILSLGVIWLFSHKMFSSAMHHDPHYSCILLRKTQ